MKISQLFSLAVSSLTVSGAMLFSYPANSAVFQFQGTNISNFPLISRTFVLGGSSGNPLTVNSLTSPSFPITLISNNNTPQVNASFTGGAVAPGGTFDYTIDIADNPDGTAALNVLKYFQTVATPSGTQDVPIPTFVISGNPSAGGTQTPFSAYQVDINTNINGKDISSTSFFQLPGNGLNISNTVLPATFTVSSQPIAGYVPFDQLTNFGPPVTIPLAPGGSLNVPVTPTTPATPVPEPSLVVALSAMGWGAFLKRKLFKNQAKAS